jgi:hypothetical protein
MISGVRTQNSKLTLWFLNRVVSWEVLRRGQLAAALAANGSLDVRLGRRVVRKLADTGDVAIPVNRDRDCFPGELMDEGYSLSDRSKKPFDEYFVPIPVKSLGLPHQKCDYWDTLIQPEKRADFELILNPSVNACFGLDGGHRYWDEGHKLRARRRSRIQVPDLSQMFGDVRINTKKKDAVGYYEILQAAKAEHGPNVLVGYSQGGLVANYLAYIDEHLVKPEHRCIAGVISVHGPLRGSTLGMHEIEHAVLKSLVEAVRPALGIPWLISWLLPTDVRDLCMPLFEKDQIDIDDVDEVIDLFYFKTSSEKHREILRTARKWLSGLASAADLAFVDIDPLTISRRGTVLHSLIGHPLVDTWRGTVNGACFELKPFIRGAVGERLGWLSPLEGVLMFLLRKRIARAQEVIRTKTFDMMPNSLQADPPELVQLHEDWASELLPEQWGFGDEFVPARAHDFVIPTASQLLMPRLTAGEKFLGSRVNPNSTHLSGATDLGKDSDFVRVKNMLLDMGNKVSP